MNNKEKYEKKDDNGKLFIFLSVAGLIMMFGFAGIYWAYFRNTEQISDDAIILEGDGYLVEIKQSVYLTRTASNPFASAEIQYEYEHNLDSTVNVSSTDAFDIQTKTRVFEGSGSLHSYARWNRPNGRTPDPINVSTNGYIDYDETAGMGFYYYFDPQLYSVSDNIYINFIVTVDDPVSSDSVRLGFVLYGTDRNTDAGNFGIGFEDADVWFNLNQSRVRNIWGLFLIDDIRECLDSYEPTVELDGSDINITKTEFYFGSDNPTYSKQLDVYFDYLFMITRPITMTGGAWLDDDELIVDSYQIITEYNITTLDAMFNVTTSGVHTNISLFIKDYIDIDRVKPVPFAADIVDGMLTYLDLIEVENESGLTIVATTKEGEPAHKISGSRASGYIPLLEDTNLGVELDYTFNANFTVLGLQINDEWATDSLDSLKHIGDFTVHIGQSIWVE